MEGVFGLLTMFEYIPLPRGRHHRFPRKRHARTTIIPTADQEGGLIEVADAIVEARNVARDERVHPHFRKIRNTPRERVRALEHRRVPPCSPRKCGGHEMSTT
jgi:hypothetical protein